MLVFFENLSFKEFQIRYLLLLLLLFSAIHGFGWFWMGSLQKNIHVNAGVPLGYILGHALFLQYISDVPDDVICNIAIYDDNTALYY